MRLRISPQHLSVLRRYGLVVSERRASVVYYRLAFPQVADLLQWPGRCFRSCCRIRSDTRPLPLTLPAISPAPMSSSSRSLRSLLPSRQDYRGASPELARRPGCRCHGGHRGAPSGLGIRSELRRGRRSRSHHGNRRRFGRCGVRRLECSGVGSDRRHGGGARAHRGQPRRRVRWCSSASSQASSCASPGSCALGRTVSYIPWPVIEGFTVGIGVIIFLQQVPAAVGVSGAGHSTNAVIAAIESVPGRGLADSAVPLGRRCGCRTSSCCSSAVSAAAFLHPSLRSWS